VTQAQCALCKEVINSHLGYSSCTCGAIGVDDGRYIAKDLRDVIQIKDAE